MYDKNRKRSFVRQHESYCRAAKLVNDSKKQRQGLSAEFLRVPYGLTVKK